MSTTEEPTQADDPMRRPGLSGATLGPISIAILVVAAAAPLFVMAGIAPLPIGFGGVGAPSGYLFAGVSLAVLAIGFTAMSKYVRNAGAFYAYIARGLGPGVGIVAAVVALVSYNALEIGMFGALGYFSESTIAEFTGVSVEWWVWALAGAVIVWYLGTRSIHVGSRFLIALLTAETGILVVLATAVLLKGGARGLDLASFAPSNVFTPQLGAVLAFAFAAFMGFESTALYREEARRPDRTIPLATFSAVAFLGLFYAFLTWIIVQAYGDDAVQEAAQRDPGNLFFVAMEQYVGHGARMAMEVLILTSILASIVAFHNAITRYAFALSREQILPAALGKLHPRHLSPYVATAWQSVLAIVVIGAFGLARLDPMTQLLIWVNTPGVIGVIFLQAVVGLAVLAFFRRDRRGHSVFRVVVAPIAGSVLLLGALALVIRNIALITAAPSFSDPVNVVALATIPVAVLVGAALALRLRRTRPDVYAAAGTRAAD